MSGTGGKSIGSRRGLVALLAVVLAAVALLALNLFGQLSLQRFRLDVTEEKLFTITDATRRVLKRLEEPVTLKFYHSRALGAQAPQYAEYGARVEAMLRQYVALAPGRVRVEIIDPEPYSPEEDKAIAAGLQPVPLPDGRNAWFGIVGENLTGKREVLAFLPVERAPLLEYDLTSLIFRLSQPKRPVVGVLTSLPMFGKVIPGQGRLPEWAIIAQLRTFYEVKRIDPAGKPEQLKNVDVLLLATPVLAADPMWKAVERFVLSGKPAILAIDPVTEAGMTEVSLLGKNVPQKNDRIVRMLATWGIDFSVGKFVADPAFARMVLFSDEGRERQAPWLAWLELDNRAFAKQFVSLFVNVPIMNVASIGAFSLAQGAKLTLEPVIASSEKAMLMDAKLVLPPDPLKVLGQFKPGSKRHWLAVRARGEATAFHGKTKPKKGKVNLLLIGDTDFLANRFWARLQDIGGGRKLVLPLAGNATFLLNALQEMSGGEALSGLTGRMVKPRRFERIEALRKRAEQLYRAREQQLRQQLKAAEAQLSGITARIEGSRLIISERDREKIAKVRAEILSLRRSLRDVQQALVRDIRRLEFRIKVLNIVGAALLVALAGLFVWFMRRLMAWRGRVLASREG